MNQIIRMIKFMTSKDKDVCLMKITDKINRQLTDWRIVMLETGNNT